MPIDFPDLLEMAMTTVPVFERDALINELLRFNFTGIGNTAVRKDLEDIREGLMNVICGDEDEFRHNSHIVMHGGWYITEMLKTWQSLHPHIILLIDRLRDLMVRVAASSFEEPDRLHAYAIYQVHIEESAHIRR